MTSSVPVNIVITGGPGSGKTTLINCLRQEGFLVCSEQAIDLIDELINEWGIEQFIQWKRNNQLVFQTMILERQLSREADLPDSQIRFFDRGHLDPLAYLGSFQRTAVVRRYFNNYRSLQRSNTLIPYKLVFQCETLSEFNPRRQTGRTELERESIYLGNKLKEIYQSFHIPVVVLGDQPIQERLEIIYQTLANSDRIRHC